MNVVFPVENWPETIGETRVSGWWALLACTGGVGRPRVAPEAAGGGTHPALRPRASQQSKPCYSVVAPTRIQSLFLWPHRQGL
jgi:hypothetical protein